MNPNNAEWELHFDRPIRQSNARSSADLAQAVERAFEYPQDALSMIWLGHKVRIPYAYGLSDILDDVLGMLDALTLEHGSHEAAFSADEPGGLDADWILSWKNDELTIDAEWRSAPGGLTESMKGGSRVRMSRTTFVKSWIQLLQFLCDSVSGVELEHNDEVQTIENLATAFQKDAQP